MSVQVPLSEAVVICTRNRPNDLEQTLDSVGNQSGAEARLVLIVDGSDPDEAVATAHVVEHYSEQLPCRYYKYPGPPAQTRQRNTAIELLSPPIDVVHFIDDDVSLQPGYFQKLTDTLADTPSLLGVGGLIIDSSDLCPPPSPSWTQRVFLLSTRTPSQVLPSGQTTPPRATGEEIYPADWLSTCSSTYRLSVLKRHSFDPEVEGPSPTLHDLDFSYRVAQEGPLAVVSTAKCIHHRSQNARRGIRSSSHERVARRYWFVRKNMDHPVHRLAFWWSILGTALARLLSKHPDSTEALRGLLRGVHAIWTRGHPLLRPDG